MNETAKNIIKYVSLALAIMLCVSIVMPFSCYFALFTCSMAFDDSSVDCRKEFGALTGFTEVPPCETAIYQNTHGGFHGDGITAMVIGQVRHLSASRAYAQGYAKRYGKDGFMLLIPGPQDLVTGLPQQSAIATLTIQKYD